MKELTNTRIRVSGQLVAGLVLAGLGILFTLDNLHLVRAREVLRYWPAILLFVGISQVLQARSSAGMIGGAIWILIGGVLLGQRLNLISNMLRFWPLVLVAIGAYVVWQSMNRRAVQPGDGSDRVSAVALLGGVDRRVTSSSFQGADLTAFMGGGKLDLREATIPPGAEAAVDVTAMMGGFEIRVPESWNVIVDIIPFMGGYEDKTRHPTDPSAPRLRVRGFVMMGGVEIKN
jgi:cell wall-active antibiotic response 4TMS protein YvqF